MEDRKASGGKDTRKATGRMALYALKLRLFIRGLVLTAAFKLGSNEELFFSDYLLTRVGKRRNSMDARFAIRLFMAETDIARLSEISNVVYRCDYGFSKREWMGLIESRIWEKGGDVGQLIESSDLDESTKQSYERMARFYSGELSGPELVKARSSGTHSTWLWFLPKFFTIYALCEGGVVEQGEKILLEVIKRDPNPFIEFQDKFECTGYRKYHIPG